MKTVIFVRHGKSSWEYQVDDKDRPLKERGIRDAHLVAKALRSENRTIDFAFSSPANRALHTCMIFLRTLNYNLEDLDISNSLYDFSGDSIHRFLKGVDNEYNTVLLFGHNYAFTNLVNMLGDAYVENLPTSGMAIIELDVENWSDLQKGKTKKLVFPKDLR